MYITLSAQYPPHAMTDADYSEWSETSTTCYQDWSDANSEFYELWSNGGSKFYSLWSEMSGAMYGGEKDFAKIKEASDHSAAPARV